MKYRHARTKFTLIGPWVHRKWFIKVDWDALKDLGISSREINKDALLDMLHAKGIEIKNSL
jgi:hypothetical protein